MKSIITMLIMFAPISSFAVNPLDLAKQSYLDLRCSFSKKKCKVEMLDAFKKGNIDETEAYLRSGVSPAIIFERAFSISGDTYFLWTNSVENREYKSQQQKAAFDLFLKFGGQITDDNFYHAIRSSNLSVIHALLSNEELRHDRHVNHALLFSHIRQGNIEIIEFLIEQKVELNPTGKTAESPLIELARHSLKMRGLYLDNVDDQLLIAQMLIDNGADVNFSEEWPKHIEGDAWGTAWTPLTRAINNEHFELAKLLIENGADVNLANGFGETPLTMAVRGDFWYSQRYVELLVKSGAELNLANSRGSTPLMLANTKYRKQIFNYLKEVGAE